MKELLSNFYYSFMQCLGFFRLIFLWKSAIKLGQVFTSFFLSSMNFTILILLESKLTPQNEHQLPFYLNFEHKFSCTIMCNLPYYRTVTEHRVGTLFLRLLISIASETQRPKRGAAGAVRFAIHYTELIHASGQEEMYPREEWLYPHWLLIADKPFSIIWMCRKMIFIGKWSG